MTAESPLPIICPNCRVSLVRFPRGEAEDIVFCPKCGAGGTYKDVLADRGNLETNFLSQKQIEEFLQKLEIPPVDSPG